MECFGMPVFKDYTREELKQIKIEKGENYGKASITEIALVR